MKNVLIATSPDDYEVIAWAQDRESIFAELTDRGYSLEYIGTLRIFELPEPKKLSVSLSLR